MKIDATGNGYQAQQRMYTAKRIGLNAASSAILSAGLTFAVNRGHGIKNAAGVGIFAAGVSVIWDAASMAFKNRASKKEMKLNENV